MDGNFKVRAYRERGSEPGDAPRFLKTLGRLRNRGVILQFSEPAEAADVAEDFLTRYGEPGKSYCELVFNGDKQAHSAIYLLEDRKLGIWNTERAKWPLYYPDGYGTMLAGHPWDEISDEEWDDFHGEDQPPAEDHGMESDTGDMDLGGDDEKDDEPEAEDGPDEKDDPDENGNDDQEESGKDDDGEDEDQDDDEDDLGDEGDDGDESENEQETEMPRLPIFAKFRGPLSWRKRAEAEELLDRNVFKLVLGILDPDAPTPGKQEREKFAEITSTGSSVSASLSST